MIKLCGTILPKMFFFSQTTYHTWDSSEFRCVFPAEPKKNSKKRKSGEEEDAPVSVTLTLHTGDGLHSNSVLVDDVYEETFVALKLPRDGFEVSLIFTTYNLSTILKIHAIGFIGHIFVGRSHTVVA